MPKYVYKNGNSVVIIDSNDGTKERMTMDDEFDLEFPENIDISIGKRCDGGCKYCYDNATPDGPEADLSNVKFIDSLHPYTEIAINGNSLLHPQLIPFLEKLKKRKIFANMTVNQIHFERKEDVIADLVNRELIKGLGISLRNPTPEFISKVKKYPNAVIHTINGILRPSDIEALRDNDLKILILGYKDKGRGIDYKNSENLTVKARQRYLYDVLDTLPNHFKAVSFDNLAIDQLDVKRILSPEEWDQFFMGDEGTCSMFVDLTSGKFGMSSLCTEDQMHPIMDDVRDMFDVIKREAVA